MKKFKYLFIGALMLSFSAPVMAQVDKAVLGQVKNVIASKVDVDKQMKGFEKMFKKNPEMLVAIGQVCQGLHPHGRRSCDSGRRW